MTSQPRDPELKSLFREGRSWGEDRLAANDRSRTIAWAIAGIATTVAALEAIALAGLVPMKTVVPMAVLVDRETGAVTTVDPTHGVNLAADAALTRSMLAQYVSARETIDRSSIAKDYRKVVLWSGGSARSQYLAAMKPGNPANPYSGLRNGDAVGVTIRSVSNLEPGTAMVRFDLVRQNASGAPPLAQPFVAVMRYAYRQRALSESDRFIDPLGFEVTSYRRDAETPPPAAASPASAPGSPPIEAGTGQR